MVAMVMVMVMIMMVVVPVIESDTHVFECDRV